MTIGAITDKEKWDKFVDQSRYGMLFHKWDFLKIAEKHTGYAFHPCGVFKGSELIAIFPLFVKKYMGMGVVYSPPPRTGIPYLGLVPGPQFDDVKQTRKEAHMRLVMEDLEGELTRHSAKHIYFSFAPGITDIRQFLWNGFESTVKFTYTLDLRRPLEDLWKGLETDARASIKKEALSLELSDDVNVFYRIQNDRYSQQKLEFSDNLISEKYLGELLKAYPDNIKMYFAKRDGEVVNAWIYCIYKDRCLEWIGGVNLQKDSRSNEFMRWHFIKEAKARGYGTFEIYGADVMRLCQYKSKFNPSLGCTFTLQKKALEGVLAESVIRAVSKTKSILLS